LLRHYPSPIQHGSSGSRLGVCCAAELCPPMRSGLGEPPRAPRRRPPAADPPLAGRQVRAQPPAGGRGRGTDREEEGAPGLRCRPLCSACMRAAPCTHGRRPMGCGHEHSQTRGAPACLCPLRVPARACAWARDAPRVLNSLHRAAVASKKRRVCAPDVLEAAGGCRLSGTGVMQGSCRWPACCVAARGARTPILQCPRCARGGCAPAGHGACKILQCNFCSAKRAC